MKIRSLISLVLVALIFVAFFLPWVHVESQAVGRIAQALTRKPQAAMASISGFNVPILANSPDARLMISIIRIFNPDVANADKKSWLIWFVPGLAIIMFLLGLFMFNNRWFNLSLAVIGVLIFALGFYRITTTDLDKVVLNLRIGIGVWLTLWGYLGLGLLGLVNFLKLLGQKKT